MITIEWIMKTHPKAKILINGILFGHGFMPIDSKEKLNLNIKYGGKGELFTSLDHYQNWMLIDLDIYISIMDRDPYRFTSAVRRLGMLTSDYNPELLEKYIRLIPKQHFKFTFEKNRFSVEEKVLPYPDVLTILYNNDIISYDQLEEHVNINPWRANIKQTTGFIAKYNPPEIVINSIVKSSCLENNIDIIEYIFKQGLFTEASIKFLAERCISHYDIRLYHLLVKNGIDIFPLKKIAYDWGSHVISTDIYIRDPNSAGDIIKGISPERALINEIGRCEGKFNSNDKVAGHDDTDSDLDDNLDDALLNDDTSNLGYF